MEINQLLEAAKNEAFVIQPHRNEKYNPIIHELAGAKNMTAVQIHDWFKKKGITLGVGYISKIRKAHLDSLDDEVPPEVSDLQPVAISSGGYVEGTSTHVPRTRLRPVAPNQTTAP